ncbi:MAG: Mut7-C RNAse domain-containing protein [Caldimicrobium sp.]|nr:Mut7-C RNAse domain-containing protein [Caldimicrobium sp.]MCX7874459.1 Mut7-C RNAse domain-containing protein [Caldimicrobium sp.]MDW8094105.1 Mut7-C RNAse domain-containing protein [Caldimicrobium sp.]
MSLENFHNKGSHNREKIYYLEASLSGLAKWLRFMGYQVELEEDKITPEKIWKKQDRIFLVTSAQTAKQLEKFNLSYLLLPRGPLKAQIFFVIHKLGLEPKLTLDLCSLCGKKLIPVKKEEFRGRIPLKVWKRYNEFNYCANCDKLYWEGDHIKGIRKKFQTLLKG